jgi:hypothetical protein
MQYKIVVNNALQCTDPNIISMNLKKFISQRICKYVCKLFLRPTELNKNLFTIYYLSNEMIPHINMLTLLVKNMIL